MAENIARQLERRINFRRATKMSALNTMNAGAKGIRIEVAGRLNGAEMSRREKLIQGSVPLHTLRADIDYSLATAKTQAGTTMKAWIYKGERDQAMLRQKKTKFRKVRKGKNGGVATRSNYLAFGDYGLQSLTNERITSRQLSQRVKQ